MEEQKEKIKKIIFEVTEKEILQYTDNLENKGVTSINMMGVLGNLESEFDIEIPEEFLVAENFKTINSINNMLNTLLAIN